MKKILKSFLERKPFSLKAEGASMLPILCSGDVVHYQKTPFNKLNVNDIVLIQKRKKLFTHRIIYKEILRQAQDDEARRFLITKGDNNPESDGRTYPHQTIGKVVKVKRDGKEFDPNQIYLLQSSMYFQEIIKIKSLFEKQNIDFVFLKGLPLHLYYKKEHPRRIYADCDVLVNKNDLQKAERVLFKQGYKKQDSSLSKGQKNMKDKESELAYYKVINRFVVTFDLHLEVVFMMTQLGSLEVLYQQKIIDKLTEEFLKEKRKIIIHGSSFSILSSPHLVIYLALHFFHHNYRGAFRLEFLDKVIKKECHAEFISASSLKQILKQVQDDIVRFRLQNFVYHAFVLLKKYYQTPIPQSFLKSIKPRNPLTFKLVNSLISTNIFDDEPRIKAGINRFRNLFLLSPEPLWRRAMIIFNLQVLYTGVWLMVQKIKASSRRKSGSMIGNRIDPVS